MKTINVETLAQENVRLYEENLKLRLMLGKGTLNATKETKKTNNKNETSTKQPKTNKSNKKEKKQTTEAVKKEQNNTKTDLSKFQQEREAKKAIVLAKRLEKVPVPEIAKEIGQSEPTVRNYIRELRVEGRLVK